ncbi:MAG: epoxyqueuosine reductase QueH [Treponema sp.]|jgi:predicted adenine nucleotide alpha hydrolase (AANH) superfamily ATPase|nr:epoxyqueuosine reductase QueH [Treponema sp.]
MKLLLHSCCAPCTVKCAETLSGESIQPDLFWYNPNIHPFTEYKQRRDTLVSFAAEKNLNLSRIDEYGLRSFIRAVFPDLENGSKTERPRCTVCYRMRLEKTAEHAAEKKYDAFSTTLLISPYQDHDLIKKIAEEIAEKYEVPFLYRDFRPYFREGQAKAREMGLYMQKYCGCIFSEEERFCSSEERYCK